MSDFPGASFDHWLTTPPPEDDSDDQAHCVECERWVDVEQLDDHGRCDACANREVQHDEG